MAFSQFGTNSAARKKRVYYEDASTIYEGMAVCYNSDTVSNILDYDKGAGGDRTCQTTPGTTAEGNQNEGKFMRVEDPASDNLMHFAGVVAGSSYAGIVGPRWLDIYIPNGAIVPVRTSQNCVIGEPTGVASGSNVLTTVTGDGDPVGVGILSETIDRSNGTGLALVKLFPTGQPLTAINSYFEPQRVGVTGYAYGINVNGDGILKGTAAAKSYVMQISGDRESGNVATGDSNDAILKIAGSNYAACDTNFIFRALNVKLTNGSGGTLGRVDNNISVSLKNGSTATYAVALSVDAQDLAASAKTEFGGLDVAINREGLAATLEYALQIRTRGTINTAMSQAIYLRKDATDHGFAALFGLDAAATVGGYVSTGDAPALASGDVMIPIEIGASTFYLVALADTGV